MEARQRVTGARQPLMQGISFGSEIFDDWLKAVAIEHEHLLARLLERMIDALGRRSEYASALDGSEALLALDPYREPSYVLLMQLHVLQGHSAGVEAAYLRCAEALRAEFGIRPGPNTEQAYLRATEDLKRLSRRPVERPSVRFAEGGLGPVAYTMLGVGEQTLEISPGFVGHIEIALEHPSFRAFVETLADRFQVILFDRRGVGLSERLGATSTPAATYARPGRSVRATASRHLPGTVVVASAARASARTAASSRRRRRAGGSWGSTDAGSTSIAAPIQRKSLRQRSQPATWLSTASRSAGSRAPSTYPASSSSQAR